MLKLRASALIGAFLLLGACSKTPPPQGPTDNLLEAGASGKTGDATEAVEMKILSLGEAPRQQLRYEFQVGQQKRFVNALEITATTRMPGMGASQIEIPAYEMRSLSIVEGVDKDGNFIVNSLVESIDLHIPDDADAGYQSMAASLRRDLEGLIGLRAQMVVTSTGVTLSSKTLTPDGETPSSNEGIESFENFIQNLEQSHVHLPDDDVGVGAQWQTHTTSFSQGIEMTSVSTYTIQSMDDNGVKLLASVVQTADEQPMAGDPSVPDMILTLKNLKGETSGQVDLLFGELISPISLNTNILIHTIGEAMGTSFETEVITEIKLEVRPIDD